jgi:muramoyltetrapeptide carboxypeptidase
MSERVRPPRLRPGHHVALVAPSGPVQPGALDRAVALLEGWGLLVRVGAHAGDRTGYLAGTDADRAADLTAAWRADEVRAVFCARGGYGAHRMVDLVDWAALGAAAPTVLVGSSDATALHEAVAAQLGLVSVFGPMPATDVLAGADPDAASAEHLRRTLFEAPATTLRPEPGAPGPLAGGSVSGPLVGGTLSLLAASVGTRWSVPATGAIAVLEDVTESAYRLDRLLTQLLRAGWFDGVLGVALGSWHRCGDDAVHTVVERLTPLGVPVLAGLPFGHARPQHSLPLGAGAVLDADAATLTVEPGALG